MKRKGKKPLLTLLQSPSFFELSLLLIFENLTSSTAWPTSSSSSLAAGLLFCVHFPFEKKEKKNPVN